MILIAHSIAPFLYAWAWSDRLGNREILMGAYFGLARKVAHRWKKRCHENYADLEQLAAIGLLKAIDHFDFDLEFAFSSYAIPKINGEIQHYLRDHSYVIRVPRKLLDMKAEIKKNKIKLDRKGRSLSSYQIALGLGYSIEDWNQLALIKYAIYPKDVDAAFDATEQESSHNKSSEQYRLVRQAVRRLSKQHRSVIEEIFFDRQMIDIDQETINTKMCREALDKIRYFMETDND